MTEDKEYYLLHFFLQINGQNMAQTFSKWHKINQISENGGERKIFPSANPALTYFGYNLCVMENRDKTVLAMIYGILLFTYRNSNVMENHNMCHGKP